MSRPEDLALLDRRARELAQPLSSDAPDEILLPVLGFLVAGQAYAVEVSDVREVVEGAPSSRLPWSRTAITAVTNVRGEIVPVVDAGRLLESRETRSDGPLVVLADEGRTVALRIDDLLDVTSVAPPTIRAVGEHPFHAPDLLKGIIVTIPLVDAQALFAHLGFTSHLQEST